MGHAEACSRESVGVMEARLRLAIETTERHRLSEVAGLVWRALSEGAVTEAEAESLSLMIEARKAPRTQDALQGMRGAVQTGNRRERRGSRPPTGESMIRRRRWAASGRLPPQIACQFTQGEVAVLAVLAYQVATGGDCRLALDHIAAIAGVSRTTVRNAMRHARLAGLITVEERRLSRWRNAPNIVRIISTQWIAWMRLARRSDGQKGGRNSVTGTTTQEINTGRKRASNGSKGHAGWRPEPPEAGRTQNKMRNYQRI